VLGVDVVLGPRDRVAQDLHRGQEQHHAEQQEHHVEPGEGRRAQGDEDTAQQQRTDDPVEQDALLQRLGHREGTEQQHEHEQVVHAQRLLDQVAGEVLHAPLAAEAGPHEAAEGQGS
jgi:hypothetical protein